MGFEFKLTKAYQKQGLKSMWINSITKTFFILLALKLFVEEVLEKINNHYVLKHREKIPDGFEQFIDLPTYQKSIDYTLAKSDFSAVYGSWSLCLNMIFLLSGFIPFLLGTFSEYFGITLLGQTVTFLATNIILSFFVIPFSWWRQFRLEESFGFNRSTQMIFWTDRMKGYFISFLVGLPIVFTIIYFVQFFPFTWWILGWMTFMLFQIVMIVIYPFLILPLFNKLTLLPDGELKEHIMGLAQATNFPINKIYTMDGSKRSVHSNAFFTGIGKFRHIILYDTLVEQMAIEEIGAIVAHEIGHYKHQHIRKNLILEGICSFVSFWILYYLLKTDWFLDGFGFESVGMYGIIPLVLILSIVASGITFWMEPFFNYLSRRYEYEADRFALEIVGNPEPLVSGLKKLHKENLSNLTPHPIFAAFYYSHPTLYERESALRK